MPYRSLLTATLLLVSGLILGGCDARIKDTSAHPVSGIETDSSTAILQARRTEDIFSSPQTDEYTLAVRAYIWGMPLINWANVRLYQTRPDDPWSKRPPHAAGAPINRMGLARALYGPESKDGVGPNNDTLYEIGSFDTDAGPFVIETPDFGDRYYTFTVYMADTDSFMSPGQRTHGNQLPPMFLYGPSFSGEVPDGMLPIPADTRYVLIAGRILVDGSDEDLAKVHRLQDQIRVRTFESFSNGVDDQPPVTEQRLLGDERYREDHDLGFLAKLGNILRDWHVREEEASLIESFKTIGLTTENGFNPETLSDKTLENIRRGITDARALVDDESKKLGVQINGWTTSYSGADFNGDHLLRAAVAKDQIGISVVEEAVYPIGRVDANGDLLQGDRQYRIVFPGNDLPPVDAFWSVTLYDDNGIMVDNPINRYSIGDRTKGLVTSPEGDIILALQSDKPSDENVNWLPTPDQGLFYLMMRLYVPQEAVLTQQWHPPAIRRIH